MNVAVAGRVVGAVGGGGWSWQAGAAWVARVGLAPFIAVLPSALALRTPRRSPSTPSSRGRISGEPTTNSGEGGSPVPRLKGGLAGTVPHMEQNGPQVPPFGPEEYARVEKAAQLVGKSPEVFVRDAALAAADDPFLKALGKTRDRVAQLAEVFATQETPAVDPSAAAWPDPAPMGSRDLHGIQQHGHAA
jgi:hypothetical protein